MRPMVIDRRTMLVGLGGALSTALLPPAHAASAEHYAAARRAPDGSYSAAIFGRDGLDVTAVALPGRGHGLAVCPVRGRCVVFARRPGSFAVGFSLDRSQPPVMFEAPEGRHLYGHGVFSRDGRLLYVTENDFEAGQGVIGVYDATASFARIGEFPSYGVGPHDLALLRGGTLAVANGGLREHPDIGGGRRVLNLDAIETSLVYIDAASGDLLDRHVIECGSGISLRHLAVGRDGTVVLGAQIVDGAGFGKDRIPALVYRHRMHSPLRATHLEGEVELKLAGYVSSIAVDAAGEVAAVTSSRGETVALIEIASGRVLETLTCNDVSGVASTDVPGSFLVTSGEGAIVGPIGSGLVPTAALRSDWQWDNHAVRITA